MFTAGNMLKCASPPRHNGLSHFWIFNFSGGVEVHGLRGAFPGGGQSNLDQSPKT